MQLLRSCWYCPLIAVFFSSKWKLCFHPNNIHNLHNSLLIENTACDTEPNSRSMLTMQEDKVMAFHFLFFAHHQIRICQHQANPPPKEQPRFGLSSPHKYSVLTWILTMKFLVLMRQPWNFFWCSPPLLFLQVCWVQLWFSYFSVFIWKS